MSNEVHKGGHSAAWEEPQVFSEEVRHGSEFDVRSGAVLQGPAREPVETYELRAEGENLQIRG